jgi:hypothetical protein
LITNIRRGYILTFVALLTVVFGGLNTAITSAATATPTTTSAATGANGFTISPVVSEITVNKGESQTVPITVTNPTSQTLLAQAVINDFTASNDESGTPLLILKNNVPLPANNFKSLVGNIPDTSIAPGQSAIINVTIAVPTNTFSGGYYGAVRFVPGDVTNTKNVGVTASVGTLFLVTVPGNLTQKVSLTQLSAADTNGNASSFFTNGQVSALLRLDNTGNIHVAPFGTVVVKDEFGKIISTTQFNNTTPPSYILPQSTRKFVVALPHHSYLGYYTITASLGYGNGGNNLIVATTSFWYIPIWLQIVGLIVIVVLIGLIYWIIHSIRARRFSSKK